MTWAVLAVAWFLGTIPALRISTLVLRDRYQRKLAADTYRLRPAWSHYIWAIISMVMFWPFLGLALGCWKLAFPHGVKTQYDREQELQSALRRAKREAENQDRRIRDLEKQVLAWTPRAYSQEKGHD